MGTIKIPYKKTGKLDLFCISAHADTGIFSGFAYISWIDFEGLSKNIRIAYCKEKKWKASALKILYSIPNH
jgi:hypothetical protein